MLAENLGHKHFRVRRLIFLLKKYSTYTSRLFGDSFGDYVSTPIPFDDASPHECCEGLWSVLGTKITPTQLAQLSPETIATMVYDRPEVIAYQFGEYFACEAPTVEQITAAMVEDRPEVIAQTLVRWPID
jgi:hypothetical protein